MKSMFLILASPRVGNRGHRYLVSEQCDKEAQVLRIVRDAQSIAGGEDYVAVSRLVGQEIKGHGEREGIESLILAGVDGKRTRDQAKEIQAQLNGLWSRVDSLLERLEDSGSVSSTDLIIPRHELDEWLDQLRPAAATPTSTRAKTRRRRLKWAAAGGFALVALLTAFSIQRGSDRENPWEQLWRTLDPSRDVSTLQDKPRDDKELREKLDNLAKAWSGLPDSKDLTADDVPSSILRAAGKAKDRERGKTWIHRLAIEEGSKADFKEKVRSLNPEDPENWIALLPPPDRDHAKILLKLLPEKPTWEAALRLRRSLFDVWEAFVKLRTAANEAKDDFEKLPASGEGPAFQKMIVYIVDMSLDPPDLMKLGEGFTKPMVPIFEEQDILILKHIESWLDKREVSGLQDALKQANVKIPPDGGLADQLRCLGQEGVGKALEREGDTAVRKAVTAEEDGTGIDPKAINRAYYALGGFLSKVGCLSGRPESSPASSDD